MRFCPVILDPRSGIARSLASLLSFWAFTILLFGQSGAEENSFDKALFYRAANYCRGVVGRPVALSDDREILCLDGRIENDADISSANKLKEGGLFVVRSAGGDVASVIALANVLRERRAVVVVYDQCLSSCANYLLIASDQTYVLKGSLVAWDYESIDPALPSCAKFAMEKARDGDYRLQRGSCRPLPADEPRWRDILQAQTGFYKERMVDLYFEPPPDNRYLRKVVKSLYPDTHSYHHIGWTLHPPILSEIVQDHDCLRVLSRRTGRGGRDGGPAASRDAGDLRSITPAPPGEVNAFSFRPMN
ncbi:MAG: hypothetical protein ACOY3N_31435 [Bradyrhizobium sp.]|uniref:hypothetical protein n=1 Tax=Bradyrhizobium sp. TaxID=376 RepID=UPI003BEF645A